MITIRQITKFLNTHPIIVTHWYSPGSTSIPIKFAAALSEMASNAELWLDGQVVIILCGLVASGKSTFAIQLQQHFPQFHRCNQDDLGDRRQVERLARASLAKGLSVCIDRTNFNIAQRSHWVNIAKEFPGTSIWVIVFDTPIEMCAARLRIRTNHPTIKTAEEGLHVLSRFANDFEYPEPSEGYDRLLTLNPADTSTVYSRMEIAAILQRVHDSHPVVSTPASSHSYVSQPLQGWQSRGSHRGHFSRGYSGSNHYRSSRGYNINSACVMNTFSSWQSPGENPGSRGAGRDWHDNGYFRPSPPARRDPERAEQGSATVGQETASGTPPNEGQGTAEDPLVIL